MRDELTLLSIVVALGAVVYLGALAGARDVQLQCRQGAQIIIDDVNYHCVKETTP